MIGIPFISEGDYQQLRQLRRHQRFLTAMQLARVKEQAEFGYAYDLEAEIALLREANGPAIKMWSVLKDLWEEKPTQENYDRLLVARFHMVEQMEQLAKLITIAKNNKQTQASSWTVEEMAASYRRVKAILAMTINDEKLLEPAFQELDSELEYATAVKTNSGGALMGTSIEPQVLAMDDTIPQIDNGNQLRKAV